MYVALLEPTHPGATPISASMNEDVVFQILPLLEGKPLFYFSLKPSVPQEMLN